ncbi:MAG: S8 family serine peptidase, partial [Candidatus Heimdallarchaeota archaeon]|nr:S8 family serine peptidase [Candidatus Heimdallarchaeota archaeon]
MKFTISLIFLLLIISPIPSIRAQDRHIPELVSDSEEIERKAVVKYFIPDGIPNGDVKFNTIADVLKIINVDDVHNLGYKGDNVVVGVVDTGINKNLPVFGGRVIDEKSFVTLENGYDEAEGVDDLHGHGTKVASLIAGNDTANNYIGGAPQAKLISAKVASKNGIITSD